jgi:hypothetical protein
MGYTKYIKTNDNKIIIFPETIKHAEFKSWKPVSAGFIIINTENGQSKVTCFGESISLDLKANDNDSILARKQILGLID